MRLDHNAAKVSIEPFMPLSLQFFSKQANIGPYSIRLPLWYTVSVVIDAIGMPCILGCTNVLVTNQEQMLKLLTDTALVRSNQSPVQDEHTVVSVLPCVH